MAPQMSPKSVGMQRLRPFEGPDQWDQARNGPVLIHLKATTGLS